MTKQQLTFRIHFIDKDGNRRVTDWQSVTPEAAAASVAKANPGLVIKKTKRVKEA